MSHRPLKVCEDCGTSERGATPWRRLLHDGREVLLCDRCYAKGKRPVEHKPVTQYGPTHKPITLTLPVPPSANRWWRNVNGRMVTSQTAREYKATVRVAVLSKRRYFTLPFPKGDVAVSITWTRERKSGDLDKRLGVALDALQGVMYANDAQVVELHAYRVDGGEPGVTVTVSAA